MARPRLLTYRQLHALIQEGLQEQEQRWKKANEEHEQRRKKADEEHERWRKEIDKRIGQIGRTAGTVIEEIIMSGIWEKFETYPYEFEEALQYVPVYDTIKNKTLTDIDILLAGKKHAMAVEVKSHLELADVNFHIRRMEMIQQFPPTPAQGKILLGAVGGAHIDLDACKRAHELGFFVI
jgi:radical SAM superfamily enzyme with C-terminal helix-hairpin-helix motif